MTLADEADARNRYAESAKASRKRAVIAMRKAGGRRKAPDWYIRPDGTKPEPRK